jgi:hypothetical protein
MRNATPILCLIAALVCAGTAAAADTLWSIGKKDANYKEFAAAGNHADYSKLFANDVTYTVGKSKPAEDWSYIQPGPADAWAGSKEHPFRILFDVKKAPKTGHRLFINLVDTQSAAPPTLSVRLNGHECPALTLPRGDGEGSLTNAREGDSFTRTCVFPAGWMKRGQNELVLVATAGSWLLYDSVKLESGVANSPEVDHIEAACTPMFKTVDGAMKQAVLVHVENEGLDGEGMLGLEGGAAPQKVALAQGESSIPLLVEPFTKADKRRVVLKIGDKETSATFDAQPEKQWKLFVAASAHTDIGYTDLQEKCMQLHVDNALGALDACDKLPNYKYNLEVFAQLDWFRQLAPDKFPVLEQRIKEGRMGLTALYLNMLLGICSGEELVRVLQPAQLYGRALGVPVTMASLNDVPSTVGTLPMFLRQAGVRYLADAINEDRGPSFMHAEKETVQSPYWWEGLDGSRVLTIHTITYFQARQIGMNDSMASVETDLPKFMKKFVRPDYPCDAIFINGAFVDNTVMTPRYAEVAEEWNKTWDFPKFIIATPDEYFKYVEDNFADALPVYRGDMGSFWEDGAASTAAETAMSRWAKAHVNTAEKWMALAQAHGANKDAPLKALDTAWEQILYFDEHTWGAAQSIGDPNDPQTVGQWKRKADYAKRAIDQSRDMEQAGIGALRALSAKGDAKGSTLHVSNPLSWARNILVTVPAESRATAVVDAATGKTVTVQRTAGGDLAFVAEKVPAVGYRLYTIQTGAEAAKGAALLTKDGDDFTWKGAGYRFHINPKTGALDSVTELKSGREWVDTASGLGMNQYLYVSGGNGTSLIHPNAKPAPPLVPVTHETAAVTLSENGPLRAVLHIAHGGGTVDPVDTDLVIHRDGTIDFVNVIHKKETLEKEGGYFAFPFGLNKADETNAYVELPYGIATVDQEQMPGACREWYAVNTFAATGDSTQSATVASVDTPMFTVGELNRGLWPGRNGGNRNILYAYVFNNYWHTNYKASQGGDIRCTFSVNLSDAPFDGVAATRFGWARTLDLTPDRNCALACNATGMPAEGSYLRLDNGPVLLGELLPQEGRIMARLYNPSYEPATTTITLPGARPAIFAKTDLFGDNGTPLPASGKVTVPARGMVSVTIKTR